MRFVEALELIHSCEAGASWLDYCEKHGIYHLCCDEFLDALAETIAALKPKSVLEICAGTGELGRGLRRRGIPIAITDDGSWKDLQLPDDVERLTVQQALEKYNPDCVVGCWVPVDSNLDIAVLRHPSVRFYIYIGQYMNGMVGSDAMWQEAGWRASSLPELDKLSICRADYFTVGSPPRLVQHGRCILFRRD